jgi:hypothetical protein
MQGTTTLCINDGLTSRKIYRLPKSTRAVASQMPSELLAGRKGVTRRSANGVAELFQHGRHILEDLFFA